jgi:hypothetical protein
LKLPLAAIEHPVIFLPNFGDALAFMLGAVECADGSALLFYGFSIDRPEFYAARCCCGIFLLAHAIMSTERELKKSLAFNRPFCSSGKLLVVAGRTSWARVVLRSYCDLVAASFSLLAGSRILLETAKG